VCYWALLFMPLVILHHLLNVFVQLANKRGFTKKKKKKKTSLTSGGRSVGVVRSRTQTMDLGLLTRDLFFLKVTVLSFGGALSDERSGLSSIL
jgi:hypothetical protein